MIATETQIKTTHEVEVAHGHLLDNEWLADLLLLSCSIIQKEWIVLPTGEIVGSKYWEDCDPSW